MYVVFVSVALNTPAVDKVKLAPSVNSCTLPVPVAPLPNILWVAMFWYLAWVTALLAIVVSLEFWAAVTSPVNAARWTVLLTTKLDVELDNVWVLKVFHSVIVGNLCVLATATLNVLSPAWLAVKLAEPLNPVPVDNVSWPLFTVGMVGLFLIKLCLVLSVSFQSETWSSSAGVQSVALLPFSSFIFRIKKLLTPTLSIPLIANGEDVELPLLKKIVFLLHL